MSPCPSCGRCPSCGHTPRPVPNFPQNPYGIYQPSLPYVQPQTTWTTGTVQPIWQPNNQITCTTSLANYC